MSLKKTNPADHNLYLDPNQPGLWIHFLVTIPVFKNKDLPKIANKNKDLPKIANNIQNKKLGVNGKMKKERCHTCTMPKKNCKCKCKYLQ